MTFGAIALGIDPVGPRRAMIVLTGLVGGLLAGLGTLLLTVELAPPGPRDTDAAVVPAAPPRHVHGGNGHSIAPAERAGALSLKQALRKLAAARPNGHRQRAIWE